MQDLLAGYRRFRANGWPERRRIFESLADHGQSPKVLIVACIDSRVDPAAIFDTAPGELMIVRNVANLVPPYESDDAYHGTSAALEFAVKVLGVQHIVVMGHGLCGGVKALLDNDARSKDLEFIGPWMSIAEPARIAAMNIESADERRQACEYGVIRISLANLLTFPWIEERVASGDLKLHGAWFKIRTGVLTLLQPDGTFAPAS